jgi:hypothetical protein
MMYASFDPSNLLHWVSLLIAISGLISLYISWRKFRLQYQKPKIDIFRISARPTIRDECGGLESDCFIKFYAFNRSFLDNRISGKLQRFYFFPLLTSKIYTPLQKHPSGDYVNLTQPNNVVVSMYPQYEKVKKYKHKYLLLTIKDIRGKKTRKWFKFEDFPKKEK